MRHGAVPKPRRSARHLKVRKARERRHLAIPYPSLATSRYVWHGSCFSLAAITIRRRERRNPVSRFHFHITKQTIKFMFVASMLAATLIPTFAFSAERDGATIFFSFEDLRQELIMPSTSRLAPIFTWGNQEENASRMTPIERNLTWGNGLGIDGYAPPGSRRPLWGY